MKRLVVLNQAQKRKLGPPEREMLDADSDPPPDNVAPPRRLMRAERSEYTLPYLLVGW